MKLIAAVAYLLFSSLLLAMVAATEPTTGQGYLCNLCHSRTNEHPYPPPPLEEKQVYMPHKFGGKTWQPNQKIATCLQVWNDVLDSINPAVHDEHSCREMAAMFAPQCCNEYREGEVEDTDSSVKNIGSPAVAFRGTDIRTQSYLRR